MRRDILLRSAKELVNMDVVKGLSAAPLKAAANSNEGEFEERLKEIAQQLYAPDSRSLAIEAYGEELSEIIEALYPNAGSYSVKVNEGIKKLIRKKLRLL